jgi:hypothetical protein
VVVVDNGVQRREWIKARIEAIREELDELLHELSGPESGIDEAEQRRRNFKFHKGGLGLLLLLLLSAAYLAASYRRALVGVVVAAGAVSVLAVGLFSHAAPRTNPPAGRPPARSASAAPSPSGRGAAPLPTPDRAPPVPIVVPTRTRRSQEPIETPAGEPAPVPEPARSAPSLIPSAPASPSVRPSVGPSRTPGPTPSASCPVVLRIGLPLLRVSACI